MRRALAVALALTWSSTAAAQADRFCPDRPSLGASTCTVLPGDTLIEMSLSDWTREDGDGARSDTLLVADALARFGIGRSAELQLGWTPAGHVRTRDLATGAVSTATRVGDVRVAARRNLLHPDGDALSIAVEPFVMLPVGRRPVGAGSWGAGVIMPASYEVSDAVSLSATATVEATPDDDGAGRHLAWDAILGLGYAVTSRVTAAAELQRSRDDDPESPASATVAAASLAWQPRPRHQLDAIVAIGLDHDAPDLRVAVGGAVSFR